MKKSLFLVLLSILLIATTIYADANLDIQEDSISVTGGLLQTLPEDFVIRNLGTVDITNIVFTVDSILTSGSNTIPSSNVIINSGAATNLIIAESKTIPLSVYIPETTYSGAYSGVIKASNGTYSDTVSLSVTVNSVTAMDAQSSVLLSGREDTTATKDFTIKNTGSNLITISSGNFIFTQDDFKDGTDSITLSFPTIATIAPGIAQPFSAQAIIPNNMDVGIYKGTVNVSSGTATDSFNLEVRVTPEICEDGVAGQLEVEIEDPNDGDDFYPGDNMDINVKVDNNDNDELDVITEAFLYNIDENDEIVRIESDSIEIGDSDSEDFDLKLVIPYDELNEDDTYFLYVKAYEDGNEDDQCVEDSIEINIERKKHDVQVNKITLPTIMSCGDTVTAIVSVKNQGTSDEDDVRISLKQTEIGLNKVSDFFDLDEYDDDDNEMTQRFTFTIPEDAKGDYDFETIVYFDDGDKSNSKMIRFHIECDGGSITDIDNTTGQTVIIPSDGSVITTTPVTGAVTYWPTFSLSKWINDTRLITTMFWIIGDIALFLIALYFIKLLFFNRMY